MKNEYRVEGSRAFITLSQNKEAVIDVGDLPLVSQHRWFAHRDTNTGFYAKTNLRSPGGRRLTLAMHCLINNTPDGFDTDHRDGDGLNNRRANLRTATRAENARNRGMLAHNTSGIKGVYWHQKKWVARLTYNNRLIHLGRFGTREAAAEAYRRAAERYHGEWRRAPAMPAWEVAARQQLLDYCRARKMEAA